VTSAREKTQKKRRANRLFYDRFFAGISEPSLSADNLTSIISRRRL